MISFTLDKGWKKYEAKLRTPQFERNLRTTLPPAMEKSAMHLQKMMRRTIRSGSYAAGAKSFTIAKNAPLTIAIKKSSKALADYGDLFAAITYQVAADGREAFVGVLQVTRGRDGRSLSNLAEKLHEGVEIPVTPKMRRMFYYLALASGGHIKASDLTGRAAALWKRMPGEWKALKESTTKIVIPGRPFIRAAFEHTPFHAKFKAEMENAIGKALEMMR